MLHKIAKECRSKGLLVSGQRVVVAVSAGIDSVVLLDILSRLPGIPLQLVVAHLDHGLRGRASTADAAFVRELATRYGIPCESAYVDVRAAARESGRSLEDAGRVARYAFLTEVASKHAATSIATAHHADDQAETLLLRLLRGTGPAGLAGMRSLHGQIVRPLLAWRRADIAAYAASRQLDWREDQSNADLQILRNRVRHELLPLLECYAPEIRQRLCALACFSSADDEYLTEVADSICPEVFAAIRPVSLDVERLRQLPEALAVRVLRAAWQFQTASQDPVPGRVLDALLLLTKHAGPSASRRLPGGIVARREYRRLVLQPVAATTRNELPLQPCTITGVGTYRLSASQELVVSLVTAPSAWEEIPADTIYVDPATAPWPWRVRSFIAGDRFTPFGGPGEQKIKQLFSDRKVPLAQRAAVPLLFVGDTLLWVAGLRRAALAPVVMRQTRVVRVQLLVRTR